MALRQMTTRRWMIVVAVVAVICARGEFMSRGLNPRSLIPPLTLAYLVWALLDALTTAQWSRSRVLLLLSLSPTLVAALVLQWRSENFKSRAANHCRTATLCEASALGQGGGQIIECGTHGCSFLRIPDSDSLAERTRMLRAANHHAQLRDKYRRAARLPWLSVPPDPPEPK